MNRDSPIEQIKYLAPQARLEVRLAVASHNAAVRGHKVVELEKEVERLRVCLEYHTLYSFCINRLKRK